MKLHRFYNTDGFTLAEVLITLAIVGIVAAMTIPTLIQNYKLKTLQSQFKRTYSELNQMSLLFYNDYGLSVPDYINGSVPNWKTFINTIFPQYLKGVSTIDDWMWDSTDEEGNSGQSLMPYGLYGLNGKSAVNICDVSGYKSDISGRIYSFNDQPKSGYNGPVICVDTNGEKAPNTYGKDFFLFIFTRGGTVIPYGQEHKYNNLSASYAGAGVLVGSDYCKASGSGVNNSTCAYYALTDTNPEGSGTYWKDFLNIK